MRMAGDGGQERYQVRIDVRISDREQGGSGLSISEDCAVQGGTFLELAGILGQFHEVFEHIKAQKASD